MFSFNVIWRGVTFIGIRARFESFGSMGVGLLRCDAMLCELFARLVD